MGISLFFMELYPSPVDVLYDDNYRAVPKSHGRSDQSFYPVTYPQSELYYPFLFYYRQSTASFLRWFEQSE